MTRLENVLIWLAIGAGIALAQTATTFTSGSFTSASAVNSAFSGKADLAVAINLGFVGVPGASQVSEATLTFACTIPANLAGSGGWIVTTATGSPAFAFSYIHSGSSTSVGNITTSSHAPVFPTVSAVTLAAGDTLQLTAPSSADDTLADMVVGIRCNRS